VELVNVQCESASIEDCVKKIESGVRDVILPRPGRVVSSKIELSFGAFMNLSITLLLDGRSPSDKGVIVGYHHGRGREGTVQAVLDRVNRLLPGDSEVVDFEVGTYTTPVTRRVYAVAVVVYNSPPARKPLKEYTLEERRGLIATVLDMFDNNPRVLNISELARTFNVSRDSIYYDIEQILGKKNGLSRRR